MNWLLLRGLSRELRHWGDFPQKLESETKAQSLRCLDLPGVGLARDISAPLSISRYTDYLRDLWLQDRPQGDQHLLTLSLGGMIGMDWCHRYPQDFKSLTLINSSASNLSSFYQRARPKALSSMTKVLANPFLKQREKEILNLTSNRYQNDEELIEEWVSYAESAPSSKKNWIRQLLAASQFKARRPIKAQVLVLSSKEDRLVSYRCGQKIAKFFKAPLVINPLAGHDLPLDDPDWVIKEVLNFLELSEACP